MSQENVCRKVLVYLILVVLVFFTALIGCSSPVGSALPESTNTTPPTSRDGNMQVLPERFALDLPGALLPHVQSVDLGRSSSDPSQLNFDWLEGEHNNALLNTAFWFVFADEFMSRSGAIVGEERELVEFTFDEEVATRLDKYYEEMPLFERMSMSEENNYASSFWNRYREEDILGSTFLITYSYNRTAGLSLYDKSIYMQIAFKSSPDEIVEDISFFWSTDLEKSAVLSNSYVGEGDIISSTNNLTFFSLNETEGESSFLFLELENDGSARTFEEVSLRRHPTLSDGTYFRGRAANHGFVTFGVADNSRGSLQEGAEAKQYFDSSRNIIPADPKYIFDGSNFTGMNAVNKLLDSGINFPSEFKDELTPSEVQRSNYTLEYIRERNSLYSANSNDGTPGYHNNTFTIFSDHENRVKALISAPHAVRTVRGGADKATELHTGGMARILGLMDEGEAQAFVVTNVYNDPEEPRDPNFDPYEECTYTQQVVDFINSYGIKFVLDIHGAASNRPFDIAIGTNDDQTIGNRVDIQTLIYEVNERYGFVVDYNETFPARGENTITRKVYDQTGVYTIQVEINGRYRLVGEGSVEDYNLMMDFLKDLVRSLDRLLG